MGSKEKLNGLPDPEEILDDLTNFGDGRYTARCFVRYRKDVGKWKSFWERSRNSYQIESERDYEWENNEKLKQTNHAEHYVLAQIENKVTIKRLNEKGNILARNFLSRAIPVFFIAIMGTVKAPHAKFPKNTWMRPKSNVLLLQIFCTMKTRHSLATVHKVCLLVKKHYLQRQIS